MRRFTLLFALLAWCNAAEGAELEVSWLPGERTWVGPECWANRLQDWRVAGGRLECVADRHQAMRTVHLLAARLRPGGELTMRVRVGLAEGAGAEVASDAAGGFLIGAGGEVMDPRAAAIVHGWPGPGGGLFAGVRQDGQVFFADFARELPPATGVAEEPTTAAPECVSEVELALTAHPSEEDGGLTRLTVRALTPGTGELLDEAHLDVDAGRLAGNVALVSHPGSRGAGHAGRWAFGAWSLAGDAVEARPEGALGAILSAQYTISRGVLKVSAQLFPLGGDDDRTVTLETLQEGEWQAAEAQIEEGFVATFRVESWDAGRDVPYRLVHTLAHGAGEPLVSTWSGLFRHDPVDQDEIVLAGLSCNHNNSHAIGSKATDWVEGMWFPHADLASRVAAHQPDLYFFPGDQIYEGRSPTPADQQHLELDYLYKWYLWCWAYRELTRSTPCVVIPDDHDVFQGNVWGEGGRPAARDHLGGYVHPASWVQMVQRTQTNHLPDPVDPTPVEQGIGVYYTHLVWGGVSFAILEDRKWKSGCKRPEMPPSGTGRPDHFNDPEFDTAELDLPGLELLGARQLEFLDLWARDWRGAKLKCVLSQTVFANLATHHGGRLDYLIADLDSNGWPQGGRRLALEKLRRAFAPHIAGDQHLSTLARHGLDDWDDSSWSFCLPATANFYPRAWWPPRQGEGREEGAPPWLGRHLDGFGNRVTVYAATNPGTLGDDGKWNRARTGRQPAALHDQMPGYGIVRFDKRDRAFTFECWPRGADPASDTQYAGWPRRVLQTENYAREPVAWLPELQSVGFVDPLVEVVDSTGELVYALRPASMPFTPWVFAEGVYSVEVSDPESDLHRTVRDLHATAERGTSEPVRVPR